jgi:hypothetical protein
MTPRERMGASATAQGLPPALADPAVAERVAVISLALDTEAARPPRRPRAAQDARR